MYFELMYSEETAPDQPEMDLAHFEAVRSEFDDEGSDGKGVGCCELACG
jgi:hypothetical protein